MNKTFLTVSQVFLILGGIFFAIYGLIFMFIGASAFDMQGSGVFNGIGLVMLIITGVYVFIFIRFNQAKTNELMKTEIIVWSILLMVTFNFMAGIFGLIGSMSEPTQQEAKQVVSLEGRLKDLDNLFDRGLITIEEYQERRKRIIETI